MKEDFFSSPIFAERYRFQPVTSDWDRGRSGYTHLVFDTKKGRLGVIKRAELNSQSAVESLNNEFAALIDLRGHGVPEVYDTGETEYGSKAYFYLVIEYIDGIRVEKNLEILSVSERAEILTQLFKLLATAHQKGIVNGDIDLKHLFWRRDNQQLVVIDWGNTKLGVDPKKKTEFAYDLARSAEVIYALVTRKGHPPSTGSIALPDDEKLLAGFLSLPIEFYTLCKWAPRTPYDNAQAPYTAQELFDNSNKWLETIVKPTTHKSNRSRSKKSWLVKGVSLLGFICFVLLAIYKYYKQPITFDTSTPTLTEKSMLSSPTLTLTKTARPSLAIMTPSLFS